MRIRENEQRLRLYDRLEEATDEATRSGAIDRAASYFCRMAGTETQESQIEELLQKAEKEGSLTAPEIADALDAPQLSVSATVDHNVEPD